jgi:hypothetical protein
MRNRLMMRNQFLMRDQFLRGRLVALLGAALLGFMTCSGPALAQEKTAKACQEEWRANKDANQAAGITEKAYVDKCRGAGAAATPPATPAATTTTAPAAPGSAAPEQKSAKACQDEWRGNKAAYQAGGITEKAYVDKCRAGETVAIPAVPPAAPPLPPSRLRPRRPRPLPEPTSSRRRRWRKPIARPTRWSGPISSPRSTTSSAPRVTGPPRKAPICARRMPWGRACAPPRTKSILDAKHP